MYTEDPAHAVYKYNSYSLIKVTKNNSAVSKHWFTHQTCCYLSAVFLKNNYFPLYLNP